MVWNMKMKALYNILQGGVVKNLTLNKNQSTIMVKKLPVISLLLIPITTIFINLFVVLLANTGYRFFYITHFYVTSGRRLLIRYVH